MKGLSFFYSIITFLMYIYTHIYICIYILGFFLASFSFMSFSSGSISPVPYYQCIDPVKKHIVLTFDGGFTDTTTDTMIR